MRLSGYPDVVVRVACGKCPRRGRYRLARLAERYGAEIELPRLLHELAGDCPRRDANRNAYGFCGAYYADLRTRSDG